MKEKLANEIDLFSRFKNPSGAKVRDIELLFMFFFIKTSIYGYELLSFHVVMKAFCTSMMFPCVIKRISLLYQEKGELSDSRADFYRKPALNKTRILVIFHGCQWL